MSLPLPAATATLTATPTATLTLAITHNAREPSGGNTTGGIAPSQPPAATAPSLGASSAHVRARGVERSFMLCKQGKTRSKLDPGLT
jgi:hypothetical protein